MKHGFVKVAAVTPKIVVGDTAYNADIICDAIAEAAAAGAKIIALPAGNTLRGILWRRSWEFRS